MSAIQVGLTEGQQEIRAKGVGASEVAALVGLDPYRSPIDVWRKKVEGQRSEDTQHTKRGRFLEDAILRWYASETGRQIRPSTTASRPDHPLVLATPDALAMDRVVEAKAPSWRTAHEWADGSVPERYVTQVTQQMFVADLGRGDVVAYLDEQLSIVTIEYDKELAASLVDAIETFWRKYVLTRTPPPPDASESYSTWLKERFAKTRGEIIQADNAAEEWAHHLIVARERVEAAEAAEREARNWLQNMIGDAAGMHGSFGKISWKHNKSSQKVDWEALATELGFSAEQLAKHSHEKPGPRVFRFTPAKEK